MIIFLYGPDDYRREEKRRELVAAFVKKHGRLGIGHFDLAEEGGFERFWEFARNQSLFGSEKFAMVEHLFSADGVSDKVLATELATLIEQKGITVLITESSKPAKAFDFLVRKPVAAQQFGYLTGASWLRFVEQEAERRGVRLSREAMTFLAQVYEGDTWRLVTELEKMGALGSRTVERRDLAHLDAELAPEFWDLMNGLRSPRLSDRLAALERCFGTKEPAGKLFNILAYQWPEKLSAMAGYDLAVKSGKLDYEEVLLDLVL